MPRLIGLFISLVCVMGLPALIWGDGVRLLPDFSDMTGQLRAWESWAWLAGFLLIVSDIILPIPATAVMAALGVIYGPVAGGLLSAAASMTAGTIAYWVFRALGPGVAVKLAGAEGLAAAERLFERWGGWIVAGSRWLPILPETIAGLAGLARMPFWHFMLALGCGALPMGLIAAGIGHYGADRPILAMALSALIPLALWPVAARLIRQST